MDTIFNKPIKTFHDYSSNVGNLLRDGGDHSNMARAKETADIIAKHLSPQSNGREIELASEVAVSIVRLPPNPLLNEGENEVVCCLRVLRSLPPFPYKNSKSQQCGSPTKAPSPTRESTHTAHFWLRNPPTFRSFPSRCLTHLNFHMIAR